jgi:hypothetical protein
MLYLMWFFKIIITFLKMKIMKTNYLAIAACVLVNMGLGMSWYGIFAEPWMAGHGITMQQIESNTSPMPYIATIIAALVSGYLLNGLFQRMGVKGWQDGLKTGATIGIFLFLATVASYLFSLKSINIALLDGAYMLILFTLYGTLIGGWQKKN